MPPITLNTKQLFANWLRSYSDTLAANQAVLRIRKALPRFQTRNYFARFKVERCDLDGTGQNPTNIICIVVEVSETDQESRIVNDTCDSIADL